MGWLLGIKHLMGIIITKLDLVLRASNESQWSFLIIVDTLKSEW